MVSRECSFCGTEIEPGTGMVYIRRDGAIINFCSKKCRINQTKLKRVPRKVKWTREYQNLKAIRKASEAHNLEQKKPAESEPVTEEVNQEGSQ
jgi:large subunit ribosomal protein L24e